MAVQSNGSKGSSKHPESQAKKQPANTIVTNAAGGSQSFILANFNCIPAVVLRLLSQCLGFGALKYGYESWKQIPIDDHIAHAMNHLNEWRTGDRSEPHLVNAIARTTFALWHAVNTGEQAENYQHPDMESVLRKVTNDAV